MPGQSIALGDAVLKWYDIAPTDAPVPAAISDLARLGLADAARLGELRLGASLGFVLLHRCGEGFYFLLVCTWQNDNELWETVWAKDGDGDRDFHPWPARGIAPADLLRLGARGRRPRADGVEPVPVLAPRSRRAARVPPRHVRRRGMTGRLTRAPPRRTEA